MSNPWLTIPLADYERHMRSDEVQQLDALADLFAAALDRCRPASVAVLGVGGGNGLDRVDREITKRVLGLDLNPQYLDKAQERYGGTGGLSLYCADLAEDLVDLEPAALVHAALIFEHAGLDRCFHNAVSLVARDGALSVVLQLPSSTEGNIGSSGVPSISTLRDHFAPIEPRSLQRKLANAGFQIIAETLRAVPAGKRLWMGIFRRQEPAQRR